MVDVRFGTYPGGSDERSHSKYVSNLKEDLRKAYKLAAVVADKTHQLKYAI